MQYQNGHVPTQVHYTMQPPHQQFEQKPDSPEQQKSHGVKRRFSDVEGGQVKYCSRGVASIESKYAMESYDIYLNLLLECVP